MIFVTVGAQMAFPRLIRAVDAWASEHPEVDVFAQIGPDEEEPSSIRWTKFLEPSAFKQRMHECELVVAHAGMGTIISALMLPRPILVMPRRGDLMETRNDHQVATAEHFLEQRRVEVAFDENELVNKLDRLDTLRSTESIGQYASQQLLEAIRSFIEQGSTNPTGPGTGCDGVI